MDLVETIYKGKLYFILEKCVCVCVFIENKNRIEINFFFQIMMEDIAVIALGVFLNFRVYKTYVGIEFIE